MPSKYALLAREVNKQHAAEWVEEHVLAIDQQCTKRALCGKYFTYYTTKGLTNESVYLAAEMLNRMLQADIEVNGSHANLCITWSEE